MIYWKKLEFRFWKIVEVHLYSESDSLTISEKETDSLENLDNMLNTTYYNYNRREYTNVRSHSI